MDLPRAQEMIWVVDKVCEAIVSEVMWTVHKLSCSGPN